MNLFKKIATTFLEAITTLSGSDIAIYSGKALIIKKGSLRDCAVKIMLDSGSTCHLVKRGLFVLKNTIQKKVKRAFADISFEENHFLDVLVMEWPMNSNSHEVILGKNHGLQIMNRLSSGVRIKDHSTAAMFHLIRHLNIM
ncbi:hypothetical protein PsorP6_018424 [Peronosclerospora sorghi]|nr:hypothetical protein PsorP6_018403 [Peronosclerospora sorghi]KAI9895229.1 hypothetical protein PsorP6_018424 [Peronosclerospora sorghi]